MEGVDKKEVVALMDSAVARFNKPYGKDAAPYLYERAGAKTAVKDFRGAVADYNDFYDAMMGQAFMPNFISIRHAGRNAMPHVPTSYK